MKRTALAAIVLSALLIAASYASAFLPGGAPAWAPWGLAMGMPVMLVGLMVIGASRGGRGVGRLAWPFALVGLMLAVGFALALALPADEGAGSPLYLGLPLRAAIILYGIGLLPIVILPVAYALTFRDQTLDPEDLVRVREAGEAWRRSQGLASDGSVSAEKASGESGSAVSASPESASPEHMSAERKRVGVPASTEHEAVLVRVAGDEVAP
jgi:hypothetical protein